MTSKHKYRVGIALSLFFLLIFGSIGVFNAKASTETWADYADTSWYTGNPNFTTVPIDSPQKLAGVAKLVNEGKDNGFFNFTFEVDRDLDLSAHEWMPIGTEKHPFRGRLVVENSAGIENKRVKIQGLKLSGNLTYAGLVGYMDGGIIDGFEFTSDGRIEIGSADTSGIIYVTQTVYSQTYGPVTQLVPIPDTTEAYVGAAAGKTVNGSTVNNIINHIPIKADFAIKQVYAGGIVGSSGGVLSNADNKAPVDGKGPKVSVGGIAGAGEGTVRTTVNREPVTARGQDLAIGGIVGYGGPAGLVLHKSENLGAVTADGSGVVHAAGLIGHAAGALRMKDGDTALSNKAAVQLNGGRLVYAAGIAGRAEAAVDFSDLTANSGAVTIQAASAEGSYAAALVGAIEAAQSEPRLALAFANTAAIVNHGGAQVHTGVLAGYVNSDLEWEKPYANTMAVTASGSDRVYTGGLIGKATGDVTFVAAAANSAAITVGTADRKANETYTGGLVGHLGKRLLLESTAAQAYANSGSLSIQGGSGVYTGGIAANRAYARTSGVEIANVDSVGPIVVVGHSKLYTGGWIGWVPAEGADKAISNVTFSGTIAVTATASGAAETVSTGGVVGYYVNSGSAGAIEKASFTGSITVSGGGSETYSGGIVGYMDGGTISGAKAGHTPTAMASIVSDGSAGGIAGYAKGNVEQVSVQFAKIVLQTAGGFSGGIAGKAQGTMTAASAGDPAYTDGYGVLLEAAVRDAAGGEDRITAGGLIGANSGDFVLTDSEANGIGLINVPGRSHYTLGALAGSLTAAAQLGQPGAPVSATDIDITLSATDSQVGGAVGYSRSAKQYVTVDRVRLDVKGDRARAGGISGVQEAASGTVPAADGAGAASYAMAASDVTLIVSAGGVSAGGAFGENLGDTPRASASRVSITATGADGKLGGIAGTNRGVLMESGAYRIAVAADGSGAAAGGIAGRSEPAVDAAAPAGIVRPHVQQEDEPLIIAKGEAAWIGGIVGTAKRTDVVDPHVEAVPPGFVILKAEAASSGVGGLAGRLEQTRMYGEQRANHLESVLIQAGTHVSNAYVGGLVAYQEDTALDSLTAKSVTLNVGGVQATVGGMVGYNRSSPTAFLSNVFIDGLNLKAEASAEQAKVGGFIGLNDKQTDDPAVNPVTGVSSIQNSRYVGSVQTLGPSSVTGGMVGENRSLIANNSIADKVPVTSRGRDGVIGGLVGRNAASGTLYYTYTNAALTIEGEGTSGGGLVGANEGAVIASYVELELTGHNYGTAPAPVYLGGLIGRNAGTVDKSHSVSPVKAVGGYTYVGGLVGEQKSGVISNSYAGHTVKASAAGSYAGGLIGQIVGGEVNTVYSAVQTEAENGAYAGGFAGRYDNPSKDLLYKAYYIKDESRGMNRDLPDFADGDHRWLQVHARLSTLLAATLEDRAGFPALSGWDFAQTWKYGSENAAYQYPELQRVANSGGGAGSGNEVNANISWYMRDRYAFVYDIRNEAELAGLAALVNGSVLGMDSFDFADRTIRLANPIHMQSSQWVPIGKSEQTPFQGTFDGGGYLIDGLQVKGDYPVAGLFGAIGDKGKVGWLAIEPTAVSGTGHVGAVAGHNLGQVEDVTVRTQESFRISGSVVGTLFGKNSGSFRGVDVTLASGARLTATVAGGGLIGANKQELEPKLFALSATGASLNGTGDGATIGGLVGVQEGDVRDLSRKVDYTIAVTGASSAAGGLIGRHADGRIANVTLTIAESVTASGAGSIAGGLTGVSDSGNPLSDVTVTASAEGRLTGDSVVGGIVGSKTGEGMNRFDLERIKVEKLRIASSGTGTNAVVGGIVGKLTQAAVHQASVDAPISASGVQTIAGGIAGSGEQSILDQVEVKANIAFSAQAGNSALGGVAGSWSALSDHAYDFGRRAPLYAGIYEAVVSGGPLLAQVNGNEADLSVGGIVGKLDGASVYYSKTAVDLTASGGKSVAVGGIAGTSSGGVIVSSQPIQSIRADGAVVADLGGVVGQSSGGRIHYTSAASPGGQSISAGRAVSRPGAAIVPAAHVGGLVGRGDGTTISDAYAELPVRVIDDNPDTTIYVGGFAGLLGDGKGSPGSMERVYALGAVEAAGISGSYAGGFAGSIDRYTITDAYASGKVSNAGYDTGSGGFAGSVEREAEIRSAYAKQESVSATGVNHATRSYTGGFAGYNDGKLEGVFAGTSSIRVDAAGANVYQGGLIGYHFRSGQVRDSAYVAAMQPIGHQLGDASGNAQHDASAAYSRYADWNFERDAVFLNRQTAEEWRIADGRQLAGIVQLYNADTGAAYYALFNRQAAGAKPAIPTIVLDGNADLTGMVWTPFSEFTGSLLGKGHTIKGLRMAASATDASGLIANNRGHVASLIVEGVVAASGADVGMVAGVNHDGATILDVTVVGRVEGRERIGGVTGTNAGRLEGVKGTVAVAGVSDIGGLTGLNASSGMIADSSVQATVEASGERAGGVAGTNTGEIARTSAKGSVKAATAAGGLAGDNRGSLKAVTGAELTVAGVSDIGGLTGLNASSGVIADSSVQATVEASGERAGGVAGTNTGEIARTSAKGSVKAATAAGGVAGVHEGVIRHSYASGTVQAGASEQSGLSATAGGIAGTAEGSSVTEQSFSYANVHAVGEQASAGGISGISRGAIRDAYAAGKVAAHGQALARAGGAAGYASEGVIARVLSYGETVAAVQGQIRRGQTFYGGIAGQKEAGAVIEAGYFNKQAVANGAAYYDESGKRFNSTVVTVAGANGLSARELARGELPSGLDGAVWEAHESYYPALRAFQSSDAAKISTVAVLLAETDHLSRVAGGFELTTDNALLWESDAAAKLAREGLGVWRGSVLRAGGAVLTAALGAETRTIAIDAPLPPYAEQVPMPKAASAGLVFSDQVIVTLTIDEPAAAIYYTTDGSAPTAASARYTAPLTLRQTTTLRAIGIADDMGTSQPFSETWRKQTVVFGGGGFFIAPPAIEAAIGKDSIAVGSAEPHRTARNSILRLNAPNGHIIYYTTDGSVPTKNSLIYKEGSIVITQDMTIKAITDKDDRVVTIHYEVAPAGYAIREDAAAIPYMSGVTEGSTEFRPDEAISRYELLEALEPLLYMEPVDVDNVLAGVAEAAGARVAFFTSAGIIEGYEDGTFGGERGLTRAEFVTMMARVLKLEPLDSGTTILSDVSGHWSERYVNAFARAGYVDGFEDGTFRPDIEVSRAQAVAVINRIIGKSKRGGPEVFDDVTPEHWAYGDIMAAVR